MSKYNTVWNVEKMTGYKPITTFWSDFNIAEAFGVSAIKDTYNRAFREWKDNKEYFTELVMVLNHKIWYWYDKEPDGTYVSLYNDLWLKADEYVVNNWDEDKLKYYYRITD